MVGKHMVNHTSVLTKVEKMTTNIEKEPHNLI